MNGRIGNELREDKSNRVTGHSARCNIEIKAKLISLNSARVLAHRICHRQLNNQHQVDTYFVCRSGRLKLREIGGASAQLISYSRENRSDPTPSYYRLVDVCDAAGLKVALSESLGIDVVVEKLREVYLFHNVRIHLDEVKHLGSFLEFEAVLGTSDTNDVTAARADEQSLAELMDAFGLVTSDLIEVSYSDLLRS